MENQRPYWKVIVSLTFSLIGTALFIGLGIKAMIYFMPFVIGWFISYIANPLVCALEKKLKIVKRWGSAITIIVVLCAIIGVIYFAVSQLAVELSKLVNDFPSMYRELENGAREIGRNFENVFQMLPEGVRNGFKTMIEDFDSTMGEVITYISQPTVEAAGRFAKKIPAIFIGTIVTFLSAYFFIAQREEVIAWSKKVAPQSVQKRMTIAIYNLKYAVGGYFKAQFKIMLVVSAMLFVGFMILKVHYSLLLAILISFLDFLPFFGTGTALIPWGIYKALVGDYRMVIGLVIIYVSTQLMHQLIQPKLVGDSVGMNPLVTLILLYTGYKVGNLTGMIFAVPIGMILINLFKAGAFDYILDDVKILIDGVLSLRE